MADNEMNRAAEQMSGAIRESYRALVSGAVSAQDRNARFFVGLFKNGSDLLREQAENNRAVGRTLLEQSQRQQDAFRMLSKGWFDAYANLLNAPASAYQRGVEAAGQVAEAGTRAVEQGAQQAQRGIEAAQEAAENAGQATQEAAESAVQDGQQSAREAAMPPEQVAAEQAVGEDDVVDATEAAAQKAKELGVDLSTIEGTGSGGRIVIGDVVVAAQGSRNGE